MGIIRASYLLAYLEARLAAKMRLNSREWSRLMTLRQWLTHDPAHKRRSTRRFNVRIEGKLRGKGPKLDVEVREFSAGGCRLTTSRALEIGTDVELSVELPRTTFIFSAKVERQVPRGDQIELALSFHGIPLELRRFRQRAPSLFDELMSQAG